MAVFFPRKKDRYLLLTLIYRLSKIKLINDRAKFKFFLNLEWIFNRLSLEYSFKYYSVEDHPLRLNTLIFLKKFIKPNHSVLDLGCGRGELTSLLSKLCKKVLAIETVKDDIIIAMKKHQYENIDYINMDALDYLRSNNLHFDILILSHFLEHLDSAEGFLLKYKQFFDYIYIELPDFDESYSNHYRRDLKMPLIYKDTDHIFEFDRNDIIQLFELCNLKIIESEFRFGNQKYWCKVQ